MKLKLSSEGNPDFGQNPNQPVYGCQNKTVEVNSLEEASKKCVEYITANDLGGGNWSGGQIYDDKGKQIAYVSYNGNVWEGAEDWFDKNVILYKPKY